MLYSITFIIFVDTQSFPSLATVSPPIKLVCPFDVVLLVFEDTLLLIWNYSLSEEHWLLLVVNGI